MLKKYSDYIPYYFCRFAFFSGAADKEATAPEKKANLQK